jgi:hypothetical protein
MSTVLIFFGIRFALAQANTSDHPMFSLEALFCHIDDFCQQFERLS